MDIQPDTLTFVLHKFDLGERKANELMRDVADFDVSRDGGMLLYRQQGKWTIAPLGPPPPPDSAGSGPGGGASAGSGGALNTDDIQVQTDPRAEWAEMYHESFRLQRAFFYDPNYHGLDLDKTEKFYRTLCRRPGWESRSGLPAGGGIRQSHGGPSVRSRSQ